MRTIAVQFLIACRRRWAAERPFRRLVEWRSRLALAKSTCHTARSTSRVESSELSEPSEQASSSPQRFIETHRFETFLAGSRITQCAKKRDACQGRRQDSPQLAAERLRLEIWVDYDSTAIGAHSSMHSNSQSRELKWIGLCHRVMSGSSSVCWPQLAIVLIYTIFINKAWNAPRTMRFWAWTQHHI